MSRAIWTQLTERCLFAFADCERSVLRAPCNHGHALLFFVCNCLFSYLRRKLTSRPNHTIVARVGRKLFRPFFFSHHGCWLFDQVRLLDRSLFSGKRSFTLRLLCFFAVQKLQRIFLGTAEPRASSMGGVHRTATLNLYHRLELY